MQTRPDRMLMVLPRARLVRKAVDAGFRVWSVWDPVRRGPDERAGVARWSEEVLSADLADEPSVRALVVGAAEEHRTGHVMYLGDGTGLLPVLEEAHKLGLSANPPEAQRILGDPAALRELLHGHGRLGVRFRRADWIAELPGAVREIGGHPVVARSLSRGDAVLASGPAALTRWARRAPGPYLVEEFLHGTRYVVSTLSVDGMHRVAGVTATRSGGAPDHVPEEQVHPAPLGGRESAEIRSAVCALLDLAGFEHGPADTTVVLTRTGPRIVSARPGFPGHGVSLLFGVARGTDPEAEFFRSLLLGVCPPHTPAARTAALGLLPPPPGRRGAVHVVVGAVDAGRAVARIAAVRRSRRAGTGTTP
ncbi:phosphoribosylglycinamide synthetase [Streptomyces sp. NPDC046860]|uniref:phosphoribosylglycinamide synthetase n=1 Tax=Streptomyces sp. NPDC046860 TaxID=3154495 RepID=UPI0033F9EA0C